MSDIDLAVSRSKRLEGMLERDFGASGRGLHEKADSVRQKLPEPLVRRLHFIATIRNKIVHESDYQRIDDRKGFVSACDEAEGELRRLGGRGGTSWKLVAAAAVVFALLILAAWLHFKRP